jgi:membrane-associated phospholipid phosphatase
MTIAAMRTRLATAALVTSFILEYGAESPAVYALAALPAFVGVARLKAQAHWQTDVIAAATLGAAIGTYAHARPGSFFLDVLSGGASRVEETLLTPSTRRRSDYRLPDVRSPWAGRPSISIC